MILQQAKLLVGLSSKKWGNYKRTRQGALTALLLYLYKYNVVRATTMCLPHVHPPCFFLISYYSSTCVFLKATMLPTCALTSYLYSLLYMYTPCVHHEEPMSLDVIPNSNFTSRLLSILLDY